MFNSEIKLFVPISILNRVARVESYGLSLNWYIWVDSFKLDDEIF